MNNLPKIKLGIVAVSRDCFPESLSVNRRKALVDAYTKKYNSDDVYVIGGESIYRQMLPYCNTAYVTYIDYGYEADTFFPNLEENSDWRMAEESEEQTYFDLEYYFRTYIKN